MGNLYDVSNNNKTRITTATDAGRSLATQVWMGTARILLSD